MLPTRENNSGIAGGCWSTGRSIAKLNGISRSFLSAGIQHSSVVFRMMDQILADQEIFLSEMLPNSSRTILQESRFGLFYLSIAIVTCCHVGFGFFPKLCDGLAHFYGTHLSFMTLLHLSEIKTLSEEKALTEWFETIVRPIFTIGFGFPYFSTESSHKFYCISYKK